MKRSLLIGCGNSRVKKVHLASEPEWVGELTTIDMNPDCGADIVMEMGGFRPYDGHSPGVHLPFDYETFDELAAYDSIEHWGRQGDWRGWFNEMAEYHRVLKPGGTFGIIVPIGPDALADPGHCRFIEANHFHMLNQQWYADQLAAGQQVTDYRWFWRLNFNVLHMERQGNHHLAVLLQKA